MKLVYLTLLAFNLAFAQVEDKNPAPKELPSDSDTYIKWFIPEVQKSKIPSEKVRVKFTGITVPGTLITLKERAEYHDPNGQSQKLLLKTIALESTFPLFSDEDSGRYEFSFNLPYGILKFIFEFQFPNGTFKTRTIHIETSPNKYKIVTPFENDKLLVINRSSFWLASGMNYTQLQQTRTETNAQLKFNSFEGPSFYSEFKFAFTPYFKTLISYKNTPGLVEGNEETQINIKKFNWNITAMDFLISGRTWKAQFLGKKIYLNLRTGFNHQSFPLLIQEDLNHAQFKYVTAQMFSLGAQMDLLLNRHWNFEMFLRNQAFLNTKEFKASNSFAFDGSIGVLYGLNSVFALGLYWYGQYQKYNYSVYEPFHQKDIEGTQSLLYSNMELRLVTSF